MNSVELWTELSARLQGFVRAKPHAGTPTAAETIHASASTCVRLDCSSSGVNSVFWTSLSSALPLRGDLHLLPGQAGYIFSLASPWPTPEFSLRLDVPRTPQRLGRFPKGILMSSPNQLGWLPSVPKSPGSMHTLWLKTHRPTLL